MSFQSTLRFLVTILVVAIAAAVGWRLWRHYEVEPWTRDGKVKAYVVEVAPDVTGQVPNVYVRDNQEVKVGQKLFDIDGARFELALRQAQAAEQTQRIALKQAQKEARHRAEGTGIAGSARTGPVARRSNQFRRWPWRRSISTWRG